MIMPAPDRISAESFAVQILRDEPNLDYATIRDRAQETGISVHPIHYGRARKQLGLPALRDTRPEPVARSEEPVPPPAARPARDAEPAAAATAPRKKGSPAFDFLLQELRREPTLLYAPLRDRCAERGFKIAPIMYGRAKAVLGLVPVKPRGSKRAAAEAKASAAPMQLKQVESVAADKFSKKLDDVRNLEQLVAIVRDLDAERRRLRDVLERVITMLDEALG
jgi:transposase